MSIKTHDSLLLFPFSVNQRLKNFVLIIYLYFIFREDYQRLQEQMRRAEEQMRRAEVQSRYWQQCCNVKDTVIQNLSTRIVQNESATSTSMDVIKDSLFDINSKLTQMQEKSFNRYIKLNLYI